MVAKLRRRGTVILENSKGILLVSGRSKRFMLPGGNARSREPRMATAIRELYEETGLVAKEAKFLFKYDAGVSKIGGHLKHTKHKVFLIKAEGTARPRSDVKHIAFYKPGVDIKLTYTTKKILEKYLKTK
ncbi:NUDIX domain-containing protein [Candidatus Woesearchaeota archaeon]|nr:MAG: NUDIX domain-containing protein [Candidatus Woesearchaeota archaeon]